MKVGILKECRAGEHRVAAVPETVGRLMRLGLDVLVEAGAGAGASIADAEYESAGATAAADAAAVCREADLLLKVAAPTDDEIPLFRPAQVLVAVLAPASSPRLLTALAEAGVASFSLDAIPRISRAQSMDVLSSMSTLAGYKAVLLAADLMGKVCPMMMTAAGTLKPANTLVIGAGVAGLQAIATARRLGAVVTAIDVRPAVREQVESLGARFIPMEVDHAAEDTGGYAADLGEAFYRGEQEIIAPHAAAADMIITTALVPGRRAPVLITEAMVKSMRPGSIVVDLAATAGGNCTLSRLDDLVEHDGVRILGPGNLPSQMPVHASLMFARNVATFVGELLNDQGELEMDMDNQVIAETLMTRDGQVIYQTTG